MAEYQEQYRGQMGSFLQRLSFGQKVMIVGVTLASIAAIVALVTFVNRPSFGMLFTNLRPEDASKVVEKLKEKNVPYQLDDAGKTVLVPKQQVYDLRLSLAGEGLPQASVIGYEIFDRTNLGVSDFVQKVNYRRALEGELARTILELEEVEAARVHIVLPEKTLFKDDEKATTASVVLKLKSGKPLKRETIQGISHLVSSSVEGLESNNVTIVDSRGSLLSDAAKPNSLAAMTSTQYELQQKVESYLAQKALSILEGVVGAGNALVQVNAELDFRQAERTLEQYDPDNTSVRSEQITEEKTPVNDTLPPATRANTVTNYEVNKTIEHIVENVGNIKRISVAALVNSREKIVEKNGEKIAEFTPRPQEEMDQLTDIVRKAVGYNPQRTDEISVINLPFGKSVEKEDFVYKESPFTDWKDLSEKGFLVVAMLGAVFVIRSLLSKMRVQVRSDGGGGGGFSGTSDQTVAALRAKRANIALPNPEDEISEDAAYRAERRKKITSYVQEKPAEASQLLKVWLAED
jgi:flagellar M-ring protein FliF